MSEPRSLWVELDGPDNVGKTVQTRLLESSGLITRTAGVHAYDSDWPGHRAQHQPTWWFETSSTVELTTALAEAYAKRQRRLRRHPCSPCNYFDRVAPSRGAGWRGPLAEA